MNTPVVSTLARPVSGGRPTALLLAAALALVACGDNDPPLPGPREPVRLSAAAEAAEEATRVAAPPVALPAERVNADWTHRNGTAGGSGAGNAALAAVPQLRWSTTVGEGEGKRSRILTAPVVAGGLIFTMDAAGRLSAFNARDGRTAWSRSLVPEGQEPDSGLGGGIALAGGAMYVTTGFGEIHALSPSSGGTIWRNSLSAPVRAAPAVRDGRVIVVARDDVAYAFAAGSGEELWTVEASGGTGLLGGATPAITGRIAVLPFASGEVLGVQPATGFRQWGTAVGGGRRDLSRNNINDISGDPVIVGDSVFVANQSGRTTRIEADTGARLWTMAEGAYGPVVPVGGALFFVSDTGALIRARADTGEVVWATELPQFQPPRRFLFSRGEPTTAVVHFGPVLAGSRLWVASADGFLRAFSPTSGALLAEIALPGGAATPPAVAGGVLYVVNRDGQLLAFQ